MEQICIFVFFFHWGFFSNYLLYKKSFTYIQIGLTFFLFLFHFYYNLLHLGVKCKHIKNKQSGIESRGTMGSLSALTEHRALVIQMNPRDPWAGIYLLQIYLFSKVGEQSLNTLRLPPLSQISLQEILSILDWSIHFFSSHPPATGSYTVWLWAHDTLSSAALVLGFHVYITTLASCSALFLELIVI